MRKDSLTEKNDRPRVRKKANCFHEYVWIETLRRSKEQEHGLVEYKLIDRFYCCKCLDIQENTKSVIKDPGDNMPEWF